MRIINWMMMMMMIDPYVSETSGWFGSIDPIPGSRDRVIIFLLYPNQLGSGWGSPVRGSKWPGSERGMWNGFNEVGIGWVGPDGVEETLINMSNRIRRLQSGGIETLERITGIVDTKMLYSNCLFLTSHRRLTLWLRNRTKK